MGFYLASGLALHARLPCQNTTTERSGKFNQRGKRPGEFKGTVGKGAAQRQSLRPRLREKVLPPSCLKCKGRKGGSNGGKDQITAFGLPLLFYISQRRVAEGGTHSRWTQGPLLFYISSLAFSLSVGGVVVVLLKPSQT